MSKQLWTMKMTTDPVSGVVDFQIIDEHHVGNFYGEWTAKNPEELKYHLKGVKECIDRGTFNNNRYILNDEVIFTWQEFEDQINMFYGDEAYQKRTA